MEKSACFNEAHYHGLIKIESYGLLKETDKKAPATKKSESKLKAEDQGKLQEFLVDSFKDIYYAENEIQKGLKKMETAATSKELKSSIKKHYTQTEGQIKRLEEAFKLLGEKPAKNKCEAIDGILKEGESILEDTEAGTMVRDVAIIIASQKVEHYEIATYGSLAELAKTLGLFEVSQLLEASLHEEKSTDLSLTDLAVSFVNTEAKSE